MGYLETGLAEIHKEDGTLSATSLAHFLDRYLELTLTLEDSPKLTVAAVILRGREGSEEHHQLLAPLESGFEPMALPILEERVSRVFYLDESTVKLPVEKIERVIVRDTSGAQHRSRPIRNIRDLDARLEPVIPINEMLNADREKSYPLKQSASWLGFGPNCPTIGWHMGARVIPENGTSYQPAFDKAEAARLADFMKQLPGCEELNFMTVNDGVLLANADLHKKREFFYSASRAVHVSDSGVVEMCFRGPDGNDLDALYAVLADVLAIAHYINSTRLTWPIQRVHVGYAGADGKGFQHLPEPAADRYATIDVSKLDFELQLAGLVVDLLRDAFGPLRDRIDVISSMKDYWAMTFPQGLAGVKERK